jgi:surfeit locus 1 family protein
MIKDKQQEVSFSTANRSKGYWVATVIFFTALLGVAVSLGFWQLQRMSWKEKLIFELNERSLGTAIPLPLAPLEFTKVSVLGEFLHEYESYLYTVNAKIGGQGYFIITPMKTNENRMILVNRGFVPLAKLGLYVKPTGVVGVVGLVRFSEKPNAFAAIDNIAKKIYYNRSSEKIWANNNLKGENLFVDVSEPRSNNLPLVGDTVYNLPNKHLEYALTWFGLAIALSVIFGIFVWRERKK